MVQSAASVGCPVVASVALTWLQVSLQAKAELS
jgi:hypothetical protein